MITSTADGCWNSNDRKAVLKYIKPLLYRYFFSEAIPNLKVSLNELGLSDSDLNFLKTVHFLLSPEVQALVNELPRLLRNLSHSTQKEVIEYRGVVRGRIDWNLTLKERYSQGFNDPSLFICQPATKMYDLPENQLLKFMLWKIRHLTESIELSIPDELINPEEWNNWKDIIISSYFKVKKVSKNIYFPLISLPRLIKPKTLQKAYRHRNQSYDKVAECYELYEKLFIVDDQDVLRELIENQIFEPLNNDKLFEVYVLIKMLNLLNNSDGKFEMGLLKPGQNYTARYTQGETEICVFYQKMPTRFQDCSQNKEIFQFYDLNVSMRRPDIVLKITTPENKYYQLIEVKRTDQRGYIVDSVYKVLGYIHDFEDCLKNTPNPQGILAVWDGVTIQDMKNAITQPVLILKDKDIEKGFKKILSPDERDFKPEKIKIEYYCFGSHSINSVEYQEGTLLVKSHLKPFFKKDEKDFEKIITPTNEDWKVFGEKIDELSLWNWEERYEIEDKNLNIDGDSWRVEISIGDKRIDSSGYCMGPDSLESFFKILENLIGVNITSSYYLIKEE